MIRAGVVGATGYAGSELVRWLLGHPDVELASVVSTSRAGSRLSEVVPSLLGVTELVLEPFRPEALAQLDLVCLATPHGVASALVPELEAAGAPAILDLSRDHRHAPGWVYASPEWQGESLRGARRMAAPGCFATAITLSTAPMVASNLVNGPIRVVAATGSTGSGASPRHTAHHPLRHVNMRAYKVLRHQHVPEIRSLYALIGEAPRLDFVPIGAPLDRGIFATCFIPVVEADVAAVFRDAYGRAPFVRFRDQTPQVRWVRNTPFADLAVHQTDGLATVICAIDNLGKGAASQAVQALNLAFDLDPRAGLAVIPITP